MQGAFRKNIILFVICLIGSLLLPYISIQLNPSPKSQNLSVSFNYPNASPEVIEQEVTSRLESVFVTLRGLKEIKSTSDVGRGYIQLAFDKKVVIEKVGMEIAMLIRQVYPRLKSRVSYPEISYQSKFEEEQTLLIYTLASKLTSNELKTIINDQIIASLSLEEGVQNIALAGLATEEYQIILDKDKQNSLGLPTKKLLTTLRSQLKQEALGLSHFYKNGKDRFIATRFGRELQQDQALKSLQNLPLTRQDGRLIFLKDIAMIKKGKVKTRRYFRLNGQEAITLIINAAAKVNQIRLAEALKQSVVQLEEDLKGIIRFDLVRDETQFLSAELQKIAFRAGATFLLLFLFMVFIRPNGRYLMLIWGSLIANLLVAIIFYYVFDLELHLYSIAGWTLSIGIVLDNIIVMVDHIRHHGNQGIFPAIFSATLTTIGALSVVFFIEESYQETLADFSGVFMVNLLVSLLIALIFIPALFDSLFSKQKDKKRFSIRRKRRVLWFSRFYQRFIIFTCRFRPLFLLILLLAFGLPLFLLPNKWEAEHQLAQWYNQSIGSDAYQRKIRPDMDKYLGGTLKLFFQKKDQFYFQQQKQEKTKLYLRAKMPFGGTMEQLNEIIQSVELYLHQFPEIDKYQSTVSGPDRSFIEITFKDAYENGDFPFVLKGKLESLAVEIGSADFSVFGVGRGFNNEVRGARLSEQIQLLGYDYEALWRQAQKAKNSFLEHLRIQKAFVNAERTYYEPSEEYFQIKLPQMAALQQSQLSPYRIGELLNEINLEKGKVGWINESAEDYAVEVYAADKEQNQIWNLQHNPYAVDSNQIYKHKHYLELTKEKGQQKIVRLNQRYQLVLSYEFIGNHRLSTKIKEQKLDTISQILPMGYDIRDMRYRGNRKKGEQQLFWVLIAAIIAIFMISAILFNSLRQAFIPLLLIFPAFIGIFLTVNLFKFRFDQGGFASFLLVAGLSVNAALFIINDYNNYRKRKKKLAAITCFMKAFNAKIIPILLTTLSTILGLLPFIIFDVGQPFWYPLAICTIGGLLASTLAIYLFFPMLFLRNQKTNE
jgi:multidrug efflux pump subunit AcrB